MSKKYKNIHYLNMFPNIETDFKSAIEMLDKGNVALSFFHLRKCICDVETELIKETEWYKTNKKLGNKPSYEEILKRLEKEKILNSEQVDLFTTINSLSSSYNHYGNLSNRKRQDVETLKNLCTRLDNEFPSIMAYLGVGGSSRLKFLNKKDEKEVKSASKEERSIIKADENNKSINLSKDKKKTKVRFSLTGSLKYLFVKIRHLFHKPFVFVVKFTLVLIVFGLLVSVTFINKKTSDDLRVFHDEYVVKEVEYMNDMVSDIPDAIANTFEGIAEGIAAFFVFLRFE